MKKPWGAWGWGAVGAGHGWWRYACVDVLGVGLARGRARVRRVAARRRIPFLAPGFHRLKITFTCPPFKCRPQLPLGLPHQQRTCFGATSFARDQPYASEERLLLWWWWRWWRWRRWWWWWWCVDDHFRAILNFKKTNCHTDRQTSRAIENDPSVRAYAPSRLGR